ncbi:hypothetical protein MSAN_01374200 [Mycena sanguinolenta]|uniref:Uncharacterized protein n=1 Tax=Mycena sanguinolenta TaxID=230812 RepID=A0A8H7CXW6_9AGAR|nr:hypothetical protein MSAN_01374200 [Mycena sanguinolenta]
MESLVATLPLPLSSPTMDIDLSQHPCYRKPDPRSRLKPDTVFRLKYIKMAWEAIPGRYPYVLPSIEGLYNDKFLPVPYFEFHGAGAPPADIGTPGDVYIDITRGVQALYARSEEDWSRWTPCAPREQLLCHPHFIERGHERYLNFHPEQGTEWVCRQTVLRRQQALRVANILRSSHTTSARAGWDLASTIIEGYLTRTIAGSANSAVDPAHDATESNSSELFASDSEEISNPESDSDGFYPNKRARMAASCSSASAPFPSRRKAPPSPLYHRPTPDPEIQQLEKELAALQADKDLPRLRCRKRELMGSLSTSRGFRVPPEVFQTLETEYNKYHGVGSSVAPAEAKQLLPDLKCAVDQAKEKLRGMKTNRIEAEKQLGERPEAALSAVSESPNRLIPMATRQIYAWNLIYAITAREVLRSCASASPIDMAAADDLPWPDLDMVSRGCTRGNQGQKGVLGPADSQGRCILQLRVQRDVLPVRLNRRASEWYRTLETEVTRAQNLTKTYWRKARRRQDYDSRADQDHMELHEWLQQLKDKTMSHIEVLMERGTIQGPPYAMADHIELTFLRKFIQRHAACVPHNPRLRGEHSFPVPLDSETAETAQTYVEQHPMGKFSHNRVNFALIFIYLKQAHPTHTFLPTLHRLYYNLTTPNLTPQTPVLPPANIPLMTAQFKYACAQREKVDALLAYQKCLQDEYEAGVAVKAAEKQRDEFRAGHLGASYSDLTRCCARSRDLPGQQTDPALEMPVGNPRIDKDTVAAARVLQISQDWAHDEDLANERLQVPLHRRKRRHFDDYGQDERRVRMKRDALHQLNLGGDHGSRLVYATPYYVYHNPGHREDLGFAYIQQTHSEGEEDADGEAETDSDDAARGVARFQFVVISHKDSRS